MANLKAELHEPLIRPGVKQDEETSICSLNPQAHGGYINSNLLESDLKMSISPANVVSFDENVSHLSNLFEQNEHFLMNKTAIGNKTNIGTTDEITQNQKTYMTVQDNKHHLKDLPTDSSFKTSRNGDEEVSKWSRSKSKFTCKYTCRDREPSRLPCNKIINMLKKSRLSTQCIKHYILYNTPHSSKKLSVH